MREYNRYFSRKKVSKSIKIKLLSNIFPYLITQLIIKDYYITRHKISIHTIIGVCELKNKLKEEKFFGDGNSPENIGELKNLLMEKINMAQSFLSGFQERLTKMSTLELAVLALKDIEENAQSMCIQGKEKFLEKLEYSKICVGNFQKALVEGILFCLKKHCVMKET